jgi:hypothetical protein
MGTEQFVTGDQNQITREELDNGEVIVTVNKVKWGMARDAGYKSGLEEIEQNKSFKGCLLVYWLCRDIALLISRPGAEQQDVVKTGPELVNTGALTQTELDYIYTQFGFDPNTPA